jgi:hypothetical protein
MGAGGMSKSQVSRLCAEIDERVNAFLTRPLEDAWSYLWLDATYLKVREGGRIVSRAVIVAVAVNEDGKRDVLGVATGPSEAEAFWTDFLRSLADRGLRGVKLVIADDHKGLRAAARRVFNATHQRCRVHWMRNALAHAPTKQRTAVAAMLKTIFAQETKADAEDQWNVVADALREKQPKLGALMDASREDVLAYMSFPREHWTQIASTNPLERVNREIKRRADVIGIFPNDAAIARLVGALMLETNDEWAVARRYMSLETLARVTARRGRLIRLGPLRGSALLHHPVGHYPLLDGKPFDKKRITVTVQLMARLFSQKRSYARIQGLSTSVALTSCFNALLHALRTTRQGTPRWQHPLLLSPPLERFYARSDERNRRFAMRYAADATILRRTSASEGPCCSDAAGAKGRFPPTAVKGISGRNVSEGREAAMRA